MRPILYFLIPLFFAFAEAQQTEYVDFKTAKALVGIDLDAKKIKGSIEYEFDILKATDSIFIDAKGMLFEYVLLNKKPIKVVSDDYKLWLVSDFVPSKNNKVSIGYSCSPKKAIYFVDKEDEYQVWTQGQGKYTSNWLPSFDDMNEKVIFDFVFNVDEDYKVLSNGKSKIISERLGRTDHLFDMQKPMSSYLVALAIGKYSKKVETSKSGIPLEMYYYPEDSSKVESTYRYTKQMFDYLEEEIGVPYPWQNYKQVPVKDFLYSGMENTSLTIFSDEFMVDTIGFNDRNYVNVNAHELAHQWFGNLVTETSGTHHWLQEGFATYYALLAERNVFGDDYYYWQLYNYLNELKAQDEYGESTALLNPKSSSVTFYKKGAWVLHLLREQVGDMAFKQAVKNYLQKHAFKNVETTNFIVEVEKTSGKNLTEFVEKWLKSKVLLEEEMRTSLENNETTAFLLEHEETPYLSYRKDDNDEYVSSSLVNTFPSGFHAVKSVIVKELLSKPEYPTYSGLLDEVFKSDNVNVRQTLAENLIQIPSALKTDYETLLNDKSYITIECALYNLWVNFPQERKKYLDKTKDIVGFNDKNVRMLWLVLALNTADYNMQEKQSLYKELVDYTAPKHPFQARQNAFLYLAPLDAFNDLALKHLIEASTHHNWRFKKFAKDLLENLSEDEKYKQIIANLQTKQKQ